MSVCSEEGSCDSCVANISLCSVGPVRISYSGNESQSSYDIHVTGTQRIANEFRTSRMLSSGMLHRVAGSWNSHLVSHLRRRHSS
jgi:hypothetical protein